MGDFFTRLFDPTDFVRRADQPAWEQGLGLLHSAASLLLALACLGLPAVLLVRVRRRHLPFRRHLWLLAVFLIFAGLTYLLDVYTYYTPAHRFAAVVKLLAALAGWATIVALAPVIPDLLTMRSTADLAREVARRKRLARRHRRALRALRARRRQLADAERGRSDFFAGVSHELRTPLTLILAPLESLLSGEHGALADPARRTLQTVHKNSLLLLQLLNRLLDLSRLQGKPVTVERHATDLRALTRSVLADFRPLLDQRGIGLRALVEPDGVWVSMDRYLYERILFNLLSNAVKFTPEGGRVAVEARVADDRLRLAVRDTGAGIPPGEAEKLFRGFRQLDGTPRDTFQGGGLALIKEFSELLGGTVTVASAPGEGTTFTVECFAPTCPPRAASDVEDTLTGRTALLQKYGYRAVPGTVRTEPASPELPKILIAEDNEELASYIAALLQGICHAAFARDGAEALELVRSWAPDLVLADVMIPHRSPGSEEEKALGLRPAGQASRDSAHGLQPGGFKATSPLLPSRSSPSPEEGGLRLCKAIKASPETAALPVVLATALVQREALLKGWEAGADEYLFKPFHPKELVTRVRSLLVGRRERQRAEERYRRLLDSAPDAMVIVNARGEIVLVNTKAEELFGYTRQELRGQLVELLIPERLRARHVEERARYFADPLARAMGAGRELYGRRKDGTEFPVEASLSPLQTDEGVLVSSAIRDITWRKETEERLRQAERLAAIGQMVTGLAHESRNALQQSQACLELLTLRVEDRPELLALVMDIQKAQDRLHYLYEEVRGYAAPIKLKRERTDLGTLLEETWTGLAARKDRVAVLTQETSGADLACDVDPLALEQVFRNVLDNAMSACPDPVEIRAVWSPAGLNGDRGLCVALRDNGPGIPAAEQARVFEPFFTTKTQGTGLGLAIAKRIVEAHGGRIVVGGPPAGDALGAASRGAEIVITLPRKKA